MPIILVHGSWGKNTGKLRLVWATQQDTVSKKDQNGCDTQHKYMKGLRLGYMCRQTKQRSFPPVLKIQSCCFRENEVLGPTVKCTCHFFKETKMSQKALFCPVVPFPVQALLAH
jgi:hypothetical protein